MSTEKGKEEYGVSGIEMVNRIPTPASSKQLFQAMDYYGAMMAYLWALPACFCQLKTGPIDHRKGGHFGHLACTLIIENRTI